MSEVQLRQSIRGIHIVLSTLLEKHGVKLLSTTEHITDDPSETLVRKILETVNE